MPPAITSITRRTFAARSRYACLVIACGLSLFAAPAASASAPPDASNAFTFTTNAGRTCQVSVLGEQSSQGIEGLSPDIYFQPNVGCTPYSTGTYTSGGPVEALGTLHLYQNEAGTWKSVAAGDQTDSGGFFECYPDVSSRGDSGTYQALTNGLTYQSRVTPRLCGPSAPRAVARASASSLDRPRQPTMLPVARGRAEDYTEGLGRSCAGCGARSHPGIRPGNSRLLELGQGRA
jgi:hypothetical protein